jgi:hypothetical protein
MPRGRIKSSKLIVGTLSPISQNPAAVSADQKAERDRQAITTTLKDYSRAWFYGDAEAMERCFHPELTARLLQQGRDSRPEPGIQTLPRSQGIQATLGTCTHPLERRSEVTILDVAGHSASARVLLGDWAAYIHLSFTGQRWAIVNVLWEWLSPRDRRSA